MPSMQKVGRVRYVLVQLIIKIEINATHLRREWESKERGETARGNTTGSYKWLSFAQISESKLNETQMFRICKTALIFIYK